MNTIKQFGTVEIEHKGEGDSFVASIRIYKNRDRLEQLGVTCGVHDWAGVHVVARAQRAFGAAGRKGYWERLCAYADAAEELQHIQSTIDAMGGDQEEGTDDE